MMSESMDWDVNIGLSTSNLLTTPPQHIVVSPVKWIALTPVNLYLGTNYFFTVAAPKVDFLLGYPHWLLLASASLTFLVAFNLMHLPFAWLRRSRSLCRSAAEG